MDKLFTANGLVREDGFGRIVIDTCPSDEEHLRSSVTDPETNRPQCRKLLEEFFVRGTDIIGKRGTLVVQFSFTEDSGGT